MRFVDFLKTTVLLSASAASLLAVIALIAAGRDGDERLVIGGAAWWASALVIGAWLGRRAETTPPIARLLATARSSRALPEHGPLLLLINRLWPLLLVTALGTVLGFFLPQVAAIAAGFGIIWALAWRRQEGAVAAIEERDAVRFYVEMTSPLSPMKLVRTPGFGGTFLER